MYELETEDIAAIIAENLKKLREDLKLSQDDMASKIKTSQAGYSLSESAERKLDLLNLYYTAVEFGVDLNSLFGLSDKLEQPIKIDHTTRIFHQNNLKSKDNRRSIFNIDSKIATRKAKKNRKATNGL